MQYAWLDYDEGIWNLITNIPDYGERKWADEDLALEELEGEGWLIWGPYSDCNIYYGYVMGRRLN